MFRDAKVADRERTATSFDKAQQRYAQDSEKWFDGSVDSVDRRLAACNQLLHSASFTVARLDIADSHRYLHAADELEKDRGALADLRHALLTGASDRGEVVGPPGWRTATNPDYDPETESYGSQSPYSNGRHEELPYKKAPRSHELGREPDWDQTYRNMNRKVRPAHDAITDAEIGRGNPGYGHHGSLERSDRRWVTLEAARFVAANTDTLDDSHELATRAHHHAQIKTSTFTPQRSAAICEAFVGKVVDLGRQAHRPQTVRTAAAPLDFEDQALFLC